MRKIPPSDWRVHELKTWPRYFRELVLGRKHAEFRVFDRDYRVGDVLSLREWDPKRLEYTGRQLFRRVSYLFCPHQAPTYVVLELEEVAPGG